MPEIDITKEFAPYISPTYKAVWDAHTEYRRDPSTKTCLLLLTACKDHFRSGNLKRAEACQLLGIFDATSRQGHFPRFVAIAMTTFCRLHPQLWGIAGWNDFEMSAWMTSHDPYYVDRIWKRILKTKGMVNSTCVWMVRSVCAQEPEFFEQWNESPERARFLLTQGIMPSFQ